MDWEAEARKLTFDRDMIHEITALVERAVRHEREACARVIEEGQETESNTATSTSRFLTPRRKGNIAGLVYAEAIRNRS